MRSYREQLRVPAVWWFLGMISAVLFAALVSAGFGGFVPPLVYTVFVLAVAAFLLRWGAVRVEVAEGRLRAGGETLPLADIGEVMALDEKQAALLRGPRADPAAHLLLRPYLKRGVYIALADPAGDVPYWLIGTRRPDELAAAISSNRQAMGR